MFGVRISRKPGGWQREAQEANPNLVTGAIPMLHGPCTIVQRRVACCRKTVCST